MGNKKRKGQDIPFEDHRIKHKIHEKEKIFQDGEFSQNNCNRYRPTRYFGTEQPHVKTEDKKFENKRRKVQAIRSEDQIIKHKIHEKEKTFQNGEFSQNNCNRYRPTRYFGTKQPHVKTDDDKKFENKRRKVQAIRSEDQIIKHKIHEKEKTFQDGEFSQNNCNRYRPTRYFGTKQPHVKTDDDKKFENKRRKVQAIRSEDQIIKHKIHEKEKTFQDGEFSQNNCNRYRPTRYFGTKQPHVKTDDDKKFENKRRKVQAIPSGDQDFKPKIHAKEETFQNDEFFQNKYNQYRATKKFDTERNLIKTDGSDKKLDDTTRETLAYFEKVLFSLKNGIGDDDPVLFTNNVLEQAKGQELELSCTGTSSYCIEILLPNCTDRKIVHNFMQAYAENKFEVCTNPNASHITESLIYLVLLNMQDWFSIVKSDDSEKVKFVTDAMTWLNSFGELCLENFDYFLKNTYACHVFKIVIQALGGQYFTERNISGKKSISNKAAFHKKYLGDENKVKPKTSIEHESIPKFFMKTLKKITKKFMQHEDLLGIVYHSSSAATVEVLFMVLKKRIPKYCKRLATTISTVLLSQKNASGVPTSFLNSNSSYVVEQLIKSADEEFLHDLWQQYLVASFEYLVSHPVGNFVLQRLLDAVSSQILFKIIFEEATKFFKLILQSGFYGIFLSIAKACDRLKAQQAEFVENMMHCLECSEPEDRQLSLVPLLLGLIKYDQYLQTNTPESESSNIKICLQGSLIVQALLKFSEPEKVVKSLLNMNPKNFVALADHKQGCYVLTSFFVENSVQEKNKDGLIQRMKPILPELASKRDGSFTLTRMWPILSLEQKSKIAYELWNNAKKLNEIQCAKKLLLKFGLYHYNRNYQKWKCIQQNLTKRQDQTVEKKM